MICRRQFCEYLDNIKIFVTIPGYTGNDIPLHLYNSATSKTGISTNGYVKAFYNGQWGYICTRGSYSTSGWGMDEANVVCRQLGYDEAVRSAARHVYIPDPNYVISEVVCRGDEENLQECWVDANFETTAYTPNPWGYENNRCPYGSEAGVTCRNVQGKGTKTNQQT